MTSIVTDGGAEPKLAANDAPPAQGKRRRGWFSFVPPEKPSLTRRERLTVAVATVAALASGAWLLLRGVALWQPAALQPNALLPLVYPATTSEGALLLSIAATLCGVTYLLAAAAFVTWRTWAWPLFAVAALAATLLAIAASWVGGVVDWAGLLVAFATTIVAALPTIRTATIVNH